ncbi:MAG: CinA family protein [Sciscionella sp.]
MELVRLLDALRAQGSTVATAESLTAGAVCAALTSVAESSAVVRGGLIVYASDLKSELAGVDPTLLAPHGAVHPEVAAALAVGARSRCGATWGLGLTGVAGPDSQDDVLAGLVYVAACGPREPPTVRRLDCLGDRHQVRSAAARGALRLLGDRLGAAAQ